jgi:adenylate kinase family enzyme
MKKIAVFGNTGGGKSTLSKKLSEISGLPLYALDKIQYQSGGTQVSEEEYELAHQQILSSDRWIIDGFGSMSTLWLRLDDADTLVFIDLPLRIHFWWVTKRLIRGLIEPPEGWPENSPILKSSFNCYRVLWLCQKQLTPRYRIYIDQAKGTKSIYHLRSIQEVSKFFESIQTESDFEIHLPS